MYKNSNLRLTGLTSAANATTVATNTASTARTSTMCIGYGEGNTYEGNTCFSPR